MLGGGIKYFRREDRNLLDTFRHKNYEIVFSRVELLASEESFRGAVATSIERSSGLRDALWGSAGAGSAKSVDTPELRARCRQRRKRIRA